MKIYEYRKEKMTFRNVTLQIVGFIVISLIIGCCLSYCTGQYQGQLQTVKQIPLEEKLTIIRQEDKFTPEKLKEYLEELNVKYPDIVYAQAVIESGNFKSKIFKENNNLFGMKVATIRMTKNKGEQNGHAYFDTWRDSVDDYCFYSATYLSGLSKSEYIAYLSNYAEDSSYINKIKKQL